MDGMSRITIAPGAVVAVSTGLAALLVGLCATPAHRRSLTRQETW